MEGNQYREALADSSIAPELKCLSAFVILWLLFAIVLLSLHFSWLSLFAFLACFCLNSPGYNFYVVTLNSERKWVKRSSAMKISRIWLAEWRDGIRTFFIFHFVSLNDACISSALYLHSLTCCKDRGISRTVSWCKWNPEGGTGEERKMIATVLCTSLSTECKSSSLTRSPLFSLLRLALEEHHKPFTVNVMCGLTCTPGHVVSH